jgi:spore coat protein JC
MPYPELKAILTDIGTEELAHMEMVGTIVHQLTRNLTEKQLKEGNFGAYFVNHTVGVYPCDATGVPFTASTLQVKGDPITDIHEDMAAEQKARSTYDNILRMTDDPDVRDAIRFLRAREVVHYQRFGEGLRIITDHLDDRNFYAFNPAFDKPKARAVSAEAAEPLAEPVSAPAPESPVSTMDEAPIVSVGTSSVFNENVV